MSAQPERIPVAPERLDRDGDIHASYSADRIACEQPLRPPFSYRGALFAATSGLHQGQHTFCYEAYRLQALEDFAGEPTSYADKIFHDHGESARSDPLGFYHGMQVKSGGRTFVMVGPELRFVPDSALAMPTHQETLF